MYEEEIFGTNYALWFSPDGKQLAFLRFDEAGVSVEFLDLLDVELTKIAGSNISGSVLFGSWHSCTSLP